MINLFLITGIAALIVAGACFDRKWARERVAASARAKWELFDQARDTAERTQMLSLSELGTPSPSKE